MRTLGIILIFLGIVLLVREFNPAFISWIAPYAHQIKGAFWGVTLIAFGLYMLTRRTARKLVLIAYLIYLLLYLVV
ncbi:hypothetical protein [Thermococcus piezophilus]|uniref:Sodium:proton antiporter n=1 Tax=Thermococcus piezophilus TaxID=1712654 RepID=A0A172WFK0_9EURY|nr:hypothetical protein [Thermococcus piezophilus]ANF22106.1 hypothetical protein A7C91_02060 [Thermococcus piezophilus]